LKMTKISMGKSRLREPTLSFGSYGSKTIHEPKISIGGYGSMKEPKGMSMSSFGSFKEPKGMSMGGMSGGSSGMDMFGSSKPERKSRVSHAKKGRKKVIHISQLFSGKKKSGSKFSRAKKSRFAKKVGKAISSEIAYLKKPKHHYHVTSRGYFGGVKEKDVYSRTPPKSNARVSVRKWSSAEESKKEKAEGKSFGKAKYFSETKLAHAISKAKMKIAEMKEKKKDADYKKYLAKEEKETDVYTGE
jgi:hypothetical protein